MDEHDQTDLHHRIPWAPASGPASAHAPGDRDPAGTPWPSTPPLLAAPPVLGAGGEGDLPSRTAAAGPGAPQSPPRDRPAASRRSRRGLSAVFTVIAVFLAGAGGVLVGRSMSGDGGAGGGLGVTTGGSTRPVSTVPGPVPPNALEPAEAVAAALGPAVVQIETGQGLGSGFVYDRSGLIMTAAHVVDGATVVQVRLADGRRVNGRVLGSDAATDVAVVKIEPVEGLTVAQLATGVTLHVGQMAIAIGSPFGLDQTVTAGIVSALGRTTETPGGAIPAIQTDAPINSGNSGGALADRQGRVIGINSSIITGGQQSTGNVGIGFAVPIDIAKVVADRIVAGESTVGGYLGVQGTDSTGEQSGATVVAVEAGSPAASAGLREGDVVTAVGSHQVASMIDLVAQISTNRPGDVVTLTILRDGSTKSVDVTLGTAPGR